MEKHPRPDDWLNDLSLVRLGMGRTREELDDLDDAWAMQLAVSEQAERRGDLKWLAHFFALAMAPLMGISVTTEEES